MKKHSGIRGYAAGILTMALVFTLASPAAALASKTIQILTGVEIYVDGVKMDPTDANGNPVDTFVYNGTTYVPLRAVSQSLGKPVNWDGKNQRVYIGEAPGTKQYLTDVCPPYQYIDSDASIIFGSRRYSEYDKVTMAGRDYPHAIVIGNDEGKDGWALYNLNGQYSTLTFTMGHIDGRRMEQGTLNIYLDGELSYSLDMSSEDLPQTVTVPLYNALQMKLYMNNGYYCIAGAEIH